MTQYIVFTADVQTAQAAKLRNALTTVSNAGDDIYLDHFLGRAVTSSKD